MKTSTTAERLKQWLRENNAKQVDILTRAEPFVKQYGIRLNKNDISQYISGKVEPGQKKLFILAKALNVSEAWLMGISDEPRPALPVNALPVTGMIPQIGSIRAGVPAFVEENIEGYIPTVRAHPEEYFALTVKGDSMTGAGITDGSIVVLHKQDFADDGDIVACGLNGDEATLKRLKLVGDSILLMPENQTYTPIVLSLAAFDSGEAYICGVAVEVIRKL